jgi:hypothetical protein
VGTPETWARDAVGVHPGHRRASLIVPIGERALEVGTLVQALVCMGDRYISAALRAAYDANDGE